MNKPTEASWLLFAALAERASLLRSIAPYLFSTDANLVLMGLLFVTNILTKVS